MKKRNGISCLWGMFLLIFLSLTVAEVLAEEKLKEKYIAKNIIVIPWGKNKGEFGYLKKERGHGAPDWLGGFALDSKENIYIADNGSKKILIYNQQGKKITEIDIDKYINIIMWIAVDRKDNVYVVDDINNYVVIFDNKGEFIKKIEGINFVRNDSKKNIFFGNIKYKCYIYDLEKDSFKEVKDYFMEFDEKGNYYQEIYENKKVYIGYYDAENKLIKKITPPENIIAIIGTDGSGNIYSNLPSLSEKEMTGKGYYAETIKFNNKWEMIARIKLPRYAIEYKEIVDKDGNIYIMSDRQHPGIGWNGWKDLGRNPFKIIKYEPIKIK